MIKKRGINLISKTSSKNVYFDKIRRSVRLLAIILVIIFFVSSTGVVCLDNLLGRNIQTIVDQQQEVAMEIKAAYKNESYLITIKDRSKRIADFLNAKTNLLKGITLVNEMASRGLLVDKAKLGNSEITAEGKVVTGLSLKEIYDYLDGEKAYKNISVIEYDEVSRRSDGAYELSVKVYF